ncbi:MAG TPA: hypothetical protein VLE23_07595, partial [Geminicoccaceae bacterium]|nr:hypothetical protein [Geminicoccaceae bacterium]
MRLAPTAAATTPSSAQLPFTAVAPRPGTNAISDGTSLAASAFAVLLPVPTPAAATAALGATEGPLDAGAGSPHAGLPNGGALPAVGQNPARWLPAGSPLPPPATDDPALDPPTALASAPAVPLADRGAGVTPGIAWPQVPGQSPAACGQPGSASDLPDGNQPARPPAPIALAMPVATAADDESAPRPPAGPQLAPAGAVDDLALA